MIAPDIWGQFKEHKSSSLTYADVLRDLEDEAKQKKQKVPKVDFSQVIWAEVCRCFPRALLFDREHCGKCGRDLFIDHRQIDFELEGLRDPGIARLWAAIQVTWQEMDAANELEEGRNTPAEELRS